jgi:hypothetical protein
VQRGSTTYVDAGGVAVFFGDTRGLRTFPEGNFATRVIEGPWVGFGASTGAAIARINTQYSQNLLGGQIYDDLVIGAPQYPFGVPAFGAARITTAKSVSSEPLSGAWLRSTTTGDMVMTLLDDPIRQPNPKVQVSTSGSVDELAATAQFFLVNQQCGTGNEAPLMKCEDPYDIDGDGELGEPVLISDIYGTEECFMGHRCPDRAVTP